MGQMKLIRLRKNSKEGIKVNNWRIKGKSEVVECLMISKYINKDEFIISSFNNQGVSISSYKNLKSYVIKKLEELRGGQDG